MLTASQSTRAILVLQWRERLSCSAHTVPLWHAQARPDANLESLVQHRNRRAMRLHTGRTSLSRGRGICRAQQQDLFTLASGICKTNESRICRLPQGHSVGKGHIRRNSTNRPARRALDPFRPYRLRVASIRTDTPRNRLALCRYMDGMRYPTAVFFGH